MSQIPNLARILLLGPPASGKSTVGAILAKTFGCEHYTLDTIIADEMRRYNETGRLSDSLIERAAHRLFSELGSSPAVVEFPYHDYIRWWLMHPQFLTNFSLCCVFTAPLLTLNERASRRTYLIPIDYIARCFGSTTAIVEAWKIKSPLPWAAFDSTYFSPGSAASTIVDILRSSSSTSLKRLSINHEPTRPYVGGNLLNEVEWDETLLKWLAAKFAIRTVLDVGCGTGLMIDRLKNLGIECWGIDGNPAMYSGPSAFPSRLFSVDFKNQSLDFPCCFDLVWCVEVLEHIPIQFEENIVRTIADNSQQLLFISASRPGQQGYHHVNCRTKAYWKNRFEALGFNYFRECEDILNALPDIGPFGRNDLKQNGMLFVKAL